MGLALGTFWVDIALDGSANSRKILPLTHPHDPIKQETKPERPQVTFFFFFNGFFQLLQRSK